MVNYENKMKRIKEIVSELEGGEVSLEDNVKLVKEGTKLTKECRKYLDEAELVVKKVVDGKEVDLK